MTIWLQEVSKQIRNLIINWSRKSRRGRNTVGATRYTEKNNRLKKVPTFVATHMFCASRDTRVSYGWYLLIQGYFCGVTMHFSEIIKLLYEKKKNTIHCFVFYWFFFNYCCLIIFEKFVVTPNFLFGFQ